MKCEEMIKEIYFIAGRLELLSCQKGRVLTQPECDIIDDCVDRLEVMGTHMIKACDPQIEVMTPTSEQLLDLLDEKKVIFDEGKPTEAFGRVYPAQEDTRADQ